MIQLLNISSNREQLHYVNSLLLLIHCKNKLVHFSLKKKNKLTCFNMLVTRDERKKNEVNFEADYISDSFIDKNTKSDVHFSKPEWN